MIEFFQDDCPVAISLCASTCNDELAWAMDDRWIQDYVTWFHVFNGEELIGFLAWVDSNKGRVVHYGAVPGAKGVGLAMIKGFRMAERVASREGAALCTYIETNQICALRLAEACGFIHKGDNFYEK
jgi:hypothetical protein